jgi:ADP-heptose:LPS heptosyltransferase
MKYPDEHWQEVAKCYHEVKVYEDELTGGKTEETVRIAKVQNHYPQVTEGTVAEWIRRCRRKGLL